jgi:hypothetical protein
LSRATSGEVLLARAGGSILENGCLYEACFAFAGVLRPVLTARFRDFVVAWEFMGSNGILRLRKMRKTPAQTAIQRGFGQKPLGNI